MTKTTIRQIIERRMPGDGLFQTGIRGVQLFRATEAVPCVPAVYEPCVIAIVSGAKEAVLDGYHHVYDHRDYLICPVSMPVEAGTPTAAPDKPLMGVYIALDTRLMMELTMEMGHAAVTKPVAEARGIRLSPWDDGFAEALLRLVQLEDAADLSILGEARLRELHYAILKGDAGAFARQAFAPGNGIARAISHLSNHLHDTVSIDDMATRAGMSRAVFHRRFKEATTMSPIQFTKAMRLNHAAMKISAGMTVSAAAMDVGYVSPSQFSREFKRMYGASPRQWSATSESGRS
ncbi:AraC family transcriptional regulator N-terminal domain-containing protein [Loktanella salsilacus]|uniref:AraC family transcriptional regulator n=1 Tax=Loktanella salsilacus TaxID=195913 RepID=UPI0037360997